jgi:hypothetical protein
MHLRLSGLVILVGLVWTHPFSRSFSTGGYATDDDLGENEYNDLACTTDNKTYSIKLYAHVEEYVIDAIKSASAAAIADAEFFTEKDAISSYLGTIIDNINEYLKPYKVELDLDLNAYKVEEFMVTKGFDKSCEVTDAVTARTEKGHEYLVDAYKGRIGIHLFVWGCPAMRGGMSSKVLLRHENCGRSAGVLWQGTDTTKDYIYSTLYEAISGEPNLFLDGIVPSRNRNNSICQYADKCVVSDPSINGVIVFGNAGFKNTIDYADRHTPSELGSREITAGDVENRAHIENDIAVRKY